MWPPPTRATRPSGSSGRRLTRNQKTSIGGDVSATSMPLRCRTTESRPSAPIVSRARTSSSPPSSRVRTPTTRPSSTSRSRTSEPIDRWKLGSRQPSAATRSRKSHWGTNAMYGYLPPSLARSTSTDPRLAGSRTRLTLRCGSARNASIRPMSSSTCSVEGWIVSPRKSRRKSECFSRTLTRTPARASSSPSIIPAGPPPAMQQAGAAVTGGRSPAAAPPVDRRASAPMVGSQARNGSRPPSTRRPRRTGQRERRARSGPALPRPGGLIDRGERYCRPVIGILHPAVRTWFARRFPDGPTPPQAGGWAEIAAGRHTLIAAPTGSGKTLAAFLVCIDRLYRAGDEVLLAGGPQVIYVSPLKALAVDIHQNLEAPLREIAGVAAELGLRAPAIRVAVRTGDTASSERAAMLVRPPDFLVTTPESLYLLVTAERSRGLLAGVQTVILDEIHAVAGNKRGSHLALTLERLQHVTEAAPQRIGLSATQRPIDAVARLLVGAGPDRSNPDGSPRCAIVDVGHRRALDLALELPDDELGAVASGEQMAEILDRIAHHVRAHRTTLVFVNTRRMAERIAHQLGERLGEDQVAAHHGSLSRDRRQRVESRLRAGDLRALVATASLELGIDIGPVELVCQIGSPRSFATFLQRVGRSNHTRFGTPRGVLYPTTRDELVECAALLRGTRAGRLDAIVQPVAPVDIAAQQIIAECATEEWSEDVLFDLVRRAAPFAGLSRRDFDDVVELVSTGITTGRGRRAAYLHRDRVNGRVKGRRGARLAALTSGGAIPELGDYRVVAEPDDTFVGTVNEDWAIESAAGDVFLLGTTSWRIRRVEPGTVRVVDAHGAPPSVPFWLG